MLRICTYASPSSSGCDMTYHKDRLLQDIYDLLCDELLFWQKCVAHQNEDSSASPSLSSAGHKQDIRWAVPVAHSSDSSPKGAASEERLEDLEGDGGSKEA